MKYVISDVMTITKRQLLQLARIPELLVFSTIQPVMFVLLFRFVFGGSIETGQPGGYVQLFDARHLRSDRGIHLGCNCSWLS